MRDSDDATGDILESDLRVSIGLPGLVRCEESNVAFARRDGEAFLVSPDLDRIDVRLEPLLQLSYSHGRLEDVEIVSIGLTEGSVGREVGDEVIE